MCKNSVIVLVLDKLSSLKIIQAAWHIPMHNDFAIGYLSSCISYFTLQNVYS
jgi:hypothetical protein